MFVLRRDEGGGIIAAPGDEFVGHPPGDHDDDGDADENSADEEHGAEGVGSLGGGLGHVGLRVVYEKTGVVDGGS